MRVVRLIDALAMTMLLIATQETALWEEAIRSSDLADTLLSPAPAAALCRDAWMLVHAWRLYARVRGAETR